MSRILERARELILLDDSLTDANNCRNSSAKLANTLKQEFGGNSVSIIAFPEATEGDGVHYAIETMEGDIINPVPAPGIPQHIGPKSTAFPIFSLFKHVKQVK